MQQVATRATLVTTRDVALVVLVAGITVSVSFDAVESPPPS